MPRNKKPARFKVRSRKPERVETTISLSRRKTAENLIACGNLIEQAREQLEAAQIKFNDQMSAILTEHGIASAELVTVRRSPPEVVVVIKSRLAPDRPEKKKT